MFCRLLLLCSAFILLAFLAPAYTQSDPPSNPPEDTTCGLPKSGTIVASVTYTLRANCSQTGTLQIKTADTPNVTLTIDGKGHTISNGTGVKWGMSFLIVDDQGASTIFNLDTTTSPNVKVIIRNVTFDGNGLLFRRHTRQGQRDDGTTWLYSGGIGSWISAEGALEMENVTFTEGNGTWLRAEGTATLTNVLFEDTRTYNWGISPTVIGGLHVANTGRVTVHNAVFRDNYRSVVVVEKGGRLTTTGCLTFIRNFTHNVHHSGLSGFFGTWSDSSAGPCSGSIGNNGQAVDTYSQTFMDCGLPADGIIWEDAVYTLTQDCLCMNTVTLAAGVEVTINANGYSINGCVAGASGDSDEPPRGSGSFLIGGLAQLTINNANINGVRMVNYGGALTVAKSKVSATSPTPIHNHGYVNVYDSTFDSNHGFDSSTRGSVYYATDLFRMGRALFRDNMFRSNTGGPAELLARGPGTSIILCGDNERDDPPPEEGADEPTPVWLPLFMTIEGGVLGGCDGPQEVVVLVPQPQTGGGCRPGQTHLPPNKMLGAIGFICHVEESPAAAIEIWEISPNNEGFFSLSVSQSEIDAVAEGFVACSRTGRAAVRVGLTDAVHQQIQGSRIYQDPSIRGGRDIQISLGPTSEGKVHHYVIDEVLDGVVLGTVDTIPHSPPCLGFDRARIVAAAPAPAPTQIYAAAVNPQAPRADGSIVHIVGQGDTIWAIGVAYGLHPHDLIALNELPERGSYIVPGQELLIRAAA